MTGYNEQRRPICGFRLDDSRIISEPIEPLKILCPESLKDFTKHNAKRQQIL
jgi:hypothetical protein